MLIVIIALGTTDILFALDSIPAIFGITQEPYLVFTANVFALMGLRQLYFLLGGLLERLVYLSLGLSFILAFIGVKLVLHALHENELGFINDGEHVDVFEISSLLSLGVILVTLVVTGRGQPGQGQEGPEGKGRGVRQDPPRNPCAGLRVDPAMTSDLPALSVLDLVPVRTDQTTADALAATLSLARAADTLGYRRYWVAEHHNMPAVAATNPPVLIAMLAGATRQIRVGSGGVMLPNHAPLVVAEQFALLEAAYPGRIDLGIGRAPGTDPVTSWALRHGAGGVSDEAVTRFPEYVDNVLAMMEPAGVGLAMQGRQHVLRATPSAQSVPQIWLLGSSDYSARLAAEKGMPYVFAHHFSGSGTAEALELYRSTFRPSPELAEPRTFLTLNASVAETAEEAERRALPQLLQMVALRTGQPLLPQPLVEEAEKAELPEAHRNLVEAMRSRWVIGCPRRRPRQDRRPGRDVRRRRGHAQPRRRRLCGHRTHAQPRPRGDAPAPPRLNSCFWGSFRRLTGRPNVGSFRGASRLPGSLQTSSIESV